MPLGTLSCETSPTATAAAGIIVVLGAAIPIADAAAQVTCNLPLTVGGGITQTSLGGPARSDRTSGLPGIGWGVGDGHCNGSFVVTTDDLFPSLNGVGIELGMRAEQRSIGQVDPVGSDYAVETGTDPIPS